MHVPVRSSFATDDPEAARHHLAALYRDLHLQVSRPGEAFGYRHDRVDLGPAVLDDVHNGLRTSYAVPPTGQVFVVQVRAGHVLTTAGRAEGRASTGDVFLVGTPETALHSTYSDDADVAITSVDLALLHRIDPQHAAARLDRPTLTTLDRPTADAWNRTTAHLHAALDADPARADGVPGQLVLDAWARLLGAAVLQVFTPEAADADAPDADAGPAPLRRAVAHIEAHPDVDLSPADLAEVAGVGVRALQLAFRKHLDTSPLAYLRRVRLDRVHADLLAADPAHQTVARIAAGWGFTDPSRFTAQYKQAYGELPSRTLHT